ncbi:MAG: hypothetical protein AB7E68_06035, partial [Candidatus Babeliales bacterium]
MKTSFSFLALVFYLTMSVAWTADERKRDLDLELAIVQSAIEGDAKLLEELLDKAVEQGNVDPNFQIDQKLVDLEVNPIFLGAPILYVVLGVFAQEGLGDMMSQEEKQKIIGKFYAKE